MKRGVVEFRGERLCEAREARGLTVAGLAELLGLNRNSVGKYERGVISPSLQVVTRMAQILRLPTGFFFQQGVPVSDALFYRSMAANTKTSRLRAERKYGWLKHLFTYVSSYVRTPSTNLPELEIPSDPLAIEDQFIESAAMATREAWGLGVGPISDVMLLLENNGVVVSRIFVGSAYMDGYSSIDSDSGQAFVVLASDKGAAVRSRFDLAHELGHLILHRNLPQSFVKNPVNNKLLEDQAHSFAGAFLVPEQALANELWIVTLDSLRDLKSRWLVSIGALLYRVGTLGWLTDAQKRGLWMNYSRRGWKRSEPLDDVLEPEVPRMLPRAVQLIIEKGGVPANKVVADLLLHPADILELAGLTETYFSASVDLDLLPNANPSRALEVTEDYRIGPSHLTNIN